MKTCELQTMTSGQTHARVWPLKRESLSWFDAAQRGGFLSDDILGTLQVAAGENLIGKRKEMQRKNEKDEYMDSRR